jgi:hypothetical protein
MQALQLSMPHHRRTFEPTIFSPPVFPVKGRFDLEPEAGFQ